MFVQKQLEKNCDAKIKAKLRRLIKHVHAYDTMSKKIDEEDEELPYEEMLDEFLNMPMFEALDELPYVYDALRKKGLSHGAAVEKLQQDIQTKASYTIGIRTLETLI